MDKGTVLATKQESTVNLTTEGVPQQAAGKFPLTVTWEGFITATEAGEYSIGVRAKGNSAMVMVGGKPLAMEYLDSQHSQAKAGHLRLEQGKKAALRVRYELNEKGPVEAQMPVSEEGFKGGDRISIDLPKPEEELLEAVTATGKPVVLVLANGSALAVNWADAHVNAIVDSWYAGEEGGAAIAETLSGKNDPAGRLPVTVYTGIDQLPPFEDYAMQNRTYRYFKGKPLYPFGYGLSYTTFAYSSLTLPKAAIHAGDPLTAEVKVTNTGKREGDEVAQLYLSFPDAPGMPVRSLL